MHPVANAEYQPNELPKPTVKDTALFKLPIWAYSATLGRVFGTSKAADNLDEQVDEEEERRMNEG